MDEGVSVARPLRRPPWDLLGVVGGLLLAVAGLIGLAAWYLALEPKPEEDLAGQARRYVDLRSGAAIPDAVADWIRDPHLATVPTQPNPLLGQRAPDFTLPSPSADTIHLGQQLAKGPVVVVFYYGYWCDHCVAQLFAIDRDYQRFLELGATIVAISGDPVQVTRERFAQYGGFQFPVLSDTDNRVASVWGVAKPALAEDGNATVDGKMDLLHATFILDQEGIVRWADVSDQPFLHNRTLLYEIVKLVRPDLIDGESDVAQPLSTPFETPEVVPADRESRP